MYFCGFMANTFFSFVLGLQSLFWVLNVSVFVAKVTVLCLPPPTQLEYRDTLQEGAAISVQFLGTEEPVNLLVGKVRENTGPL